MYKITIQDTLESYESHNKLLCIEFQNHNVSNGFDLIVWLFISIATHLNIHAKSIYECNSSSNCMKSQCKIH